MQMKLDARKFVEKYAGLRAAGNFTVLNNHFPLGHE